MAEHSYFWPDVSGDREYNDDDLDEYAGGFVTHGVFDGNLAVQAGGNMQVTIPAGRAFVGPPWKVKKYYNDSPLLLDVANADGVLNRKDIVVLRRDINARSITAQIVQGTPASSPTAPTIQRDAEIYDLELAEISIPAGTTEITQDLITDMRTDNDVCGIVVGAMKQIDTTTFYQQVQADLQRFRTINEEEFSAWFEDVKGNLGEDAAGNLMNLINDLKASKSDKSTMVTATIPASGWTGSGAPYSQTISVADVTATSANEILPGASISASQLDLLQAANLQDGGQADGSITVLAYGGKPTADLPIRIIIRGDL